MFFKVGNTVCLVRLHVVSHILPTSKNDTIAFFYYMFSDTDTVDDPEKQALLRMQTKIVLSFGKIIRYEHHYHQWPQPEPVGRA